MGQAQSEPLNTGGTIRIELQDGNLSLVQGQMVKGIAHVEQTQPFQAKNVLITLTGEESSYFWMKDIVLWKEHCGKSQIFKLEEVISNWPDGQPLPGKY